MRDTAGAQAWPAQGRRRHLAIVGLALGGHDDLGSQVGGGAHSRAWRGLELLVLHSTHRISGLVQQTGSALPGSRTAPWQCCKAGGACGVAHL